MDVPVKTQVSVQVNDQNFWDENRIGAVTGNIFVMASDWVQNITTPGTGDKQGIDFNDIRIFRTSFFSPRSISHQRGVRRFFDG